ncbi:hypothetical protein Salat_2615000 [Sesamum alatum]|uniref:Uncharacterized protein n=1 Tax=Sesamum alatum TaxID=300844 RepID=A0AAE1XP59_9LAMI|nr:hypothetical protein Salat_2615000 [Sesamum alatum]
MGSDAVALQRRVFYNTNWTVEMEKTFMDTLVDQISIGLDEPGYPDSYSVRQAMRETNREHGLSFDYGFYESRLSKISECKNVCESSRSFLESMVIVFRDPIREDSKDDEHNIHNHGNGNGNDEMDVNNLSPSSDNNSDN